MSYDWNNKKTFFSLRPGESVRYGTWRVGNREFKRTLARPSGAVPSYFAHRSCKATFTNFKETLCLKIQPGWHFTIDGIEEPVSSQSMGSLSSRWMNRERNHSILDDVRFWVNTLSQGTQVVQLSVGGPIRAEISTTPIFATLDRGIEGDYRERFWYEGVPEADSSESVREEEIVGRSTDN
jgi:hypothetical protein